MPFGFVLFLDHLVKLFVFTVVYWKKKNTFEEQLYIAFDLKIKFYFFLSLTCFLSLSQAPVVSYSCVRNVVGMPEG